MVLERRENVIPGDIELLPRRIVQDLVVQELIVPEVLHVRMEAIAFRVVVRVIEHRQDRIAIRWGRLALRTLRHPLGELEQALLPVLVPGAVCIRQERIAGTTLRRVFLVRQHRSDDDIARFFGEQFGLELQFEAKIRFRRLNVEVDGLPGAHRQSIGFDHLAIRPFAEPEALNSLRVEHRENGLVHRTRPTLSLPACSGCGRVGSSGLGAS